MVIILCICLVVAITVALFYRSKAKEFESLFELSKGYEKPQIDITEYAKGELKIEITDKRRRNKDGSIAKKRGRPSKNA